MNSANKHRSGSSHDAAEEFTEALRSEAPRYQVEIREEALDNLRLYHQLIEGWNPRLHLVAPVAPAEFATRHILESLFAVSFLPKEARVIDVGSGGGLPIVPCLILRPDIKAYLIEAAVRKSIFLREVAERLQLAGVEEIIAQRFNEITAPEADVLTCRALDRFTEVFPKLNVWSERVPRLLLYGGRTLESAFEKCQLRYRQFLLPKSDQRFLYLIDRTVLIP